GVDAPTFLARMAEGRRAIETRTAGLADVRVIALSELCGGLAGWRELQDAQRQRLEAIRRGSLAPVRSVPWRAVLRARQPLYERWVGPQPGGYLPFLLNQGAEYAALGELAQRLEGRNSLLLCCDHAAMTPFYKALHDQPVVYLQRNYT
ncbi:hypothetical protein, partial [Pelomonas sp. KK5]|uniref:hypothetical protein n=1 Tax=Pelomonas sp. KK5 TaxID=1855730 RepID=UPI001301CF70